MQSCAKTCCMEILYYIVCTKLMDYFDVEISTFGYVVGVFHTRIIKIISENFKLVSQLK